MPVTIGFVRLAKCTAAGYGPLTAPLLVETLAFMFKCMHAVVQLGIHLRVRPPPMQCMHAHLLVNVICLVYTLVQAPPYIKPTLFSMIVHPCTLVGWCPLPPGTLAASLRPA